MLISAATPFPPKARARGRLYSCNSIWRDVRWTRARRARQDLFFALWPLSFCTPSCTYPCLPPSISFDPMGALGCSRNTVHTHKSSCITGAAEHVCIVSDMGLGLNGTINGFKKKKKSRSISCLLKYMCGSFVINHPCSSVRNQGEHIIDPQ